MPEPTPRPATSSTARSTHWDTVYETRGSTGVSWFEPEPTTSLAMLDALAVGPDESVVDIGGGASLLVDHLVRRGHRDVTVLDIARSALDVAAERVGPGHGVTWLHQDLLSWQPDRRFDVWHDRAVFHFLIDPVDRDRYLDLMASAVARDGAVVLATFALDGPERCSGLQVRRYAAEDLAALLHPRFEVVTSRSELHTTPAGATQSFTWVGARHRERSSAPPTTTTPTSPP
ncbi:MAG: class I SAM-dependent methyltransferase [Acidimicrobiales bacterium]